MPTLDELIAEEPTQTTKPIPVSGGLDSLIATEPDNRKERAAAIYEHIIFSGLDVEKFSPVQEAEQASFILDELEKDNPNVRIKHENRFMLSHLFDIPLENVEHLETAMIKELYGEALSDISSSVVNRNLKDDSINALKEIPENLKIGIVGMAASALEAIKRRAIQLAGGGSGIFSDEAVKRQFEAFTPSPIPEAGGLAFDNDKLAAIRRDFFGTPRRLPGTLTAEAFGVVARLPDMGAKIIRSKQRELQNEQDIATMSNSPITKLSRSVVQSGIPSVAVAAGAAILTGNPLIGLAILGETEGGAAFQKQLDEGGSIRKSLIIGELSEAAEIAGESLVFPKLLKGLEKGISLKGALVLVGENATQEGVTGFMQSFLETYGIETTNGTPVKEAAGLAFEAGIAAIPENAFVGGVTAGTVNLASTLTSIPAKRKARNQIKTILADQGVSQKNATTIAKDVIDGDGKTAEALINKMNDDAKRRTFTGLVAAKEQIFPSMVPKVISDGLEAAKQAELEATQQTEAETPAKPTVTPPKAVEAKPAEAAKKIPPKAEAVKPVLPTKIVSPGEAGPFKVTFKTKGDLPATRIIVDPQVRRAVQSGENKLAVLKTKLKQAMADKKQAVIAATQNQITKAEAKIAKLKERQEIKLTTTIENAKVKVVKLKEATKFRDSLRRDAISMIRAIPKELQKDFILRASNVTTVKGIQRLGNEIQAGLDRAEKKEAISNLKKAAKAINPKTMLPEFAGTAKAILNSLQLGKPQEETILKNSELKAMAQQVLDTAREDSVASFQAQKMLEELREKTAKTFSINKLSLDAIEQITDTLTALRFQSESDTIAAKDENAEEAIRRRVEIKRSIVEKPELPESLGGKSVKKFKLLHDNLESALDAVAGARPGTYDLWIANKRATTQYIYDILNDGVDNQIRHNEKARNIFRQILTDNGVSSSDILNWSARPEDISLVRKATGTAPTPIMHTFTMADANKNKTKFDFTVNELMSIFMHARNSHNLSVLLNDGLDRRIDGKKQKVRGFTVEIIDDMIDSLTPGQKKIARQVGSKLMDGFNKDGINETSVKLEFFELAKIDNYWPARRSIIRTPKGKKIAGAIKTIEGMGLLKERVGIGNPMALSGFFETVYTTNKNVSAYVGLAEPLREVKSVYNTDTIEKMENVGRGDEAKVITDLIIRFEDQSSLAGPLDTIVKKMLGGFAKSKLFLNLKIAPRQQISSFLISAYVDGKYMAEFKGVGNKAIIAEIGELSPQMKARFEGLQFDRDVGDSFLEHEMMNYLTGETSLIDKTALGMKFFDTNAIVDIYRATRAEVIDKGVNVTTADGKAALKDRFEWVIRHTQPMWHPKDRSLLGSDPRPLVRSLTMFMSQREQLIRMVNNGISDYANSKKTTEDTARLGRTLGTIALNLVAFTLYNFAWAAIVHRKKRDVLDLGKSFVKDIMSLPFFGKYIAKSFDTVFNILTDKPVFSQSFDEGPIEGILREILLEAIPNYTRAGIHFISKEKYKSGPNKGQEKWGNELFVATDALISAVASLKGVPYYGAKDIIRSVNAQLTDNEKKAQRIE